MSYRANRFRIWRAATAVRWDCTSRDLAADLGLSQHYVKKICREAGWELLGRAEASSATGGKRRGVDQVMTHQIAAGAA